MKGLTRVTRRAPGGIAALAPSGLNSRPIAAAVWWLLEEAAMRCDFHIVVTKVFPPVGLVYWYAATARFYPEADAPIPPADFGECLGQTEQEAGDQMRAVVHGWLTGHGISGTEV